MSGLGFVSAVTVVLFLSAVFSGSETGVYSVSRIRLKGEARAGVRTAALILRLLRNDAGLLITLLLGNNLMLELVTHLARGRLNGVAMPPWARELTVAVVLTPVVFLLGELLPKDLFRRRPHRLLGLSVWLLSVVRVLFLPLVLPMQWLSAILERMLGVRGEGFARALAREEVLAFLRQGTREGELEPHAEELARNVLALRTTPVSKVMVPWRRADRVDLGEPLARIRARLDDSAYTRLPALQREKGSATPRVIGYVHQLDVLGSPDRPLAELLRPIPSVSPDLPVDRALGSMRTSGQRIALVGPPEAPVGLVTLMDLVAVISGEAIA